MQKNELGQLHRNALVCVDSYEGGVFRGRFFHPCNPDALSFSSLCQFLIQLENTLDGVAFPQGFNAVRSFSQHAPPPVTSISGGVKKGRLATFRVGVLFRQNASWQGTVHWLEGEKEQSFRSALELIFLMDSVLRERDQSLAG